MLTSSAKAKGRRLQDAVRSKLIEVTNSYINQENQEYAGIAPPMKLLEEDDVKVAIMGTSGVDIVLSPRAREFIQFDIECKNTEVASPWAWMKQAKANTKEGRMPMVAFTRNNEKDIYVMMRLDDVLKLHE